MLNTPAGRLHISIADDNGNIAYETTAQKLTGNFPLNLENGHYTMTVELVELPDDAGASDELVSFYLILLEL